MTDLGPSGGSFRLTWRDGAYRVSVPNLLPHDGDSVEVMPVDCALREIVTPILGGKLDEMTLHDDTGDAHDEGYMAAIHELRDWLEHGDECD